MRALSIAVSALLALGCSTLEPSTGATSGALSGSVGVLHVERPTEAADSMPTGADPTVLRAAFARYSGLDADSVLQLLGSRGPAARGRCAVIDGAGLEAASQSSALHLADEGFADVELVDVGALRVEVADTRAELVPRTFPDLASVLAGVFYAGDAELAMPHPNTDEYRFVAEGSIDVGAFEVLVPAPAVPSGVALVGADGTSASLGSARTEVAVTGALTLLWDGEDPLDLVEIELRAGDRTLACAAADEGSFRIDIDQLAELDPDAEARLVLRRVRLTPFDALGMDEAYARVGAARSFPLSLR